MVRGGGHMGSSIQFSNGRGNGHYGGGGSGGRGRGVDNRPAWMTETQQAPPPAPPAPVDDMD